MQPPGKADGSDNWIHVVEAYKPRKDLTLAYLQNSSSTFPKYAHVRHLPLHS